MIEVPFCDDMWDECRRIAIARSAPKRNWAGSFRGGPSSDEAHFLGVVGEAAACVFFGCRLNREIHGGDGHAPDIVTGGIGIEVKASKYSPPHLKMSGPEEFPRSSHIAVMVHVNEAGKVATLWGWIDRRDFMDRAITRDYGYGDRMVIEPPFKDLLSLKGIYRPQVSGRRFP